MNGRRWLFGWLLAAMMMSSAWAQMPYRDPADRFVLNVPKPWTIANADARAVVLVNGNASLTATWADGGDADPVIAALLQQVGGQWSGFQEIKRTPITLGGRKGMSVLCSGTNPRGVAAFFRIAAVAAPGGVLVLMTSVPQQQFASLKAGLDAIDKGVGFGAGQPLAPGGADPRLTALDEAYRAGVLTADEYEAKRKALQGGATTAAPAAKPTATAPARGGYQRMRLVKIMDNEGFGEPVEVLRLLVPSDWKTEGGVRWDAQQMRCPTNIIKLQFRAIAPDGVTAFELLPQYSWQWADDPSMQQIIQNQAVNGTGCDLAPVWGAADFLRAAVLPNIRPGARIGTAEPLPKVAEAEQRILVQGIQQLLQAGAVNRYGVDAARVRLSLEQNGRAVDEWISATVSMRGSPTASTAALMQGQLDYSASNYQLTAYNLFAVRAPRGELEGRAALFGQMLASARPNPAYQAAVSRFLSNMNRIAQNEVRERARIWRETNQMIQNNLREAYQQRQEVQDRMAEQFGQLMKGVDSYVDPTTREKVELSAGYRNAWTNGKGEYILSDQAGFDPSAALQENWRPLRKEFER